jgi:hypothetical protein
MAWWMYFAVAATWCDVGVARCLFPLALIILISGLDDLALDAVCVWAWLRGRLPAKPGISVADKAPHEKTISYLILVAIGIMYRHHQQRQMRCFENRTL